MNLASLFAAFSAVAILSLMLPERYNAVSCQPSSGVSIMASESSDVTTSLDCPVSFDIKSRSTLPWVDIETASASWALSTCSGTCFLYRSFVKMSLFSNSPDDFPFFSSPDTIQYSASPRRSDFAPLLLRLPYFSVNALYVSSRFCLAA